MKGLEKESAKLQKERVEALRDARFEVGNASQAEAQLSAKKVTKALAEAEKESNTLINKTSMMFVKRSKAVMISENKRQINSTLTQLELAQKQQDKILAEMKKDAISATMKRATDVIHASGDWAGIMALNSIGETMRTAREADQALATQVAEIRRKATSNAATAAEAAYESIKVADMTKAAAFVMNSTTGMVATKWAQDAEKVTLDMEQTVMKDKLSTEKILVIAKQDAVAGAKALQIAQQSITTAKAALALSKSNAKRLQKLKHKVDVMNKQATEAKYAGIAASKVVAR